MTIKKYMMDREQLVHRSEGFLEECRPHFIRYALSLIFSFERNIDHDDAREVVEMLFDSLLLHEIEIEFFKKQVMRLFEHDKLMANYFVSRSLLFLLEQFNQASHTSHPELLQYIPQISTAIMHFVGLFEKMDIPVQLSKNRDVVFEDNDNFFIYNNIIDVFFYIKNRGAKIQFMNLYKGVPITYDAEILDIDGDEVVFRTDPMQELAMKLDGKAFIVKNEFFDKHVKADIVYSNFANNTVILNNFIYLLNMPAAQRECVRVHPDTIAHVALQNHEEDVMVGKLFDLSFNGLGVVSEENHGLHMGAKVNVRFELDFPYGGTKVPIDTQGTVLNVIEYHDSYRYCMSIEPGSETEALIQRFVKEREEEIINNLKDQLKEYIF